MQTFKKLNLLKFFLFDLTWNYNNINDILVVSLIIIYLATKSNPIMFVNLWSSLKLNLGNLGSYYTL